VTERRKRCLVTGASQGLGFETTRGLCRLGFEVIMVCRDRARGEDAVRRIDAEKLAGTVSLIICDLESQAAVRAAMTEFKTRYDRLDVLVNNAGAINNKRFVTPDGLERTFAVNHLAYFLITHLLMEPLLASGDARIVNVASAAHRGGWINFDDLQRERFYQGFLAYCASKLCNILFTYELARRLEGKPITANCLHPGTVASNFGRNNRDYFGLGERLLAPFFINSERGARTSIYLASSAEVAGVSGRYFARCKPTRSSGRSYDVDAARRLWEVSESLTGISATASAAAPTR
jgi:retinol dehydrogenase 12